MTGDLDVALVTMPVPANRALSATKLLSDPLLALLPDAWRRRAAAVTAAQLGAMPLIFYEPGGNSRTITDAWLRRAGIMPGPAMEMGSAETIKHLVGAGLGATVLTSLVLRSPVPGAVTRRLRPAASRDLGIVLRREKVLDRGLRLFLAELERAVADGWPAPSWQAAPPMPTLNSTDGIRRQPPARFDTTQGCKVCSSFKRAMEAKRRSREPEGFVERLGIGPVECRREFQPVAPCLSCQGGPCIDQDAADALPARVIAHDQCRDPGHWLAVMEHERPMQGDQPDAFVAVGYKQNRVSRLPREQVQACPHLLDGEGVAKLAQQLLRDPAVARISRPDVDHSRSLDALPARGG